ncbi:MAG: hypothetical protein HY057_08985 [Rhodospirillales bacterium]|nr:hypothetical protein [Rhodospirillales bacterium]
MLARTEIRASAVARLKAAATAAEQRVFAGRSTPLTLKRFPALLVHTPSENGASIAESGAPKFRNTLRLTVEAFVTAPADDVLADALDALCEQVETALLGNAIWVSQFEQVGAFSTETDIGSDGERRIAAAKMNFDLVYAVVYAPVIDDDLGRVAIRVDTIDPADPNRIRPGPDGRIEAGIDIDVST